MSSRIATTTIPYTELEVADGNFDTSRAPIDRIVLHTMVGTWQGAVTRFDDSTSQVSAHYGVKYDGGLIHWLEEYNTAYHAGNYAINQRSIGIEHEDMGNYNDPRPDALYTTSAKLVADICKFYNIPCDRTHILDHRQVFNTGCPDALDTDRIVREAKAIINLPQPMPNIDAAKWIQLIMNNPYGWSEPAHVLKTIADLKANVDQLNQAVTDKDKQILSLQTEVTATLAHDKADCQQKMSDLRTNMLIDFGNEKKDLLNQIEDLKKNGVVHEVPTETPLRDRFHNKSLGEKVHALIDILQA